MLPRANRSNSMQVLAVPAAIANYVLGEIQQALGFSGNFLPALAGAVLIGLALRALLNVSCCAEHVCTTGWHLSLVGTLFLKVILCVCCACWIG